MPLPLIRYPLDPTGTNPDNLVIGEIHTLSTAQIRAVAPIYGPFYTESLVVYDQFDSRVLVRGTDYQVVELLQDASMKFGKEIAQLILILNHAVSSNVRINYQILGGLYQFTADGIVNMYETVMADNRPVDWINVLNKPYEYNPTLHRHLLEDIYGFEPVVVALERIRNAIILSDVPAYEALIDWVKNRMAAVVTESEIDLVTSNNKLVTWERLLYALDKLNFNAITITPTIAEMADGGSRVFTLSTTQLEDSTVLYWTIDHIDTTDADFTTTSGVINIMGNRGSFTVSLAAGPVAVEDAEHFRVFIRKNSPTGPILAKTSTITIGQHGNLIMDYLNSCCLYNPLIEINPTSYFIVGTNEVNFGRGIYAD